MQPPSSPSAVTADARFQFRPSILRAPTRPAVTEESIFKSPPRQVPILTRAAPSSVTETFKPGPASGPNMPISPIARPWFNTQFNPWGRPSFFRPGVPSQLPSAPVQHPGPDPTDYAPKPDAKPTTLPGPKDEEPAPVSAGMSKLILPLAIAAAAYFTLKG